MLGLGVGTGVGQYAFGQTYDRARVVDPSLKSTLYAIRYLFQAVWPSSWSSLTKSS